MRCQRHPLGKLASIAHIACVSPHRMHHAHHSLCRLGRRRRRGHGPGVAELPHRCQAPAVWHPSLFQKRRPEACCILTGGEHADHRPIARNDDCGLLVRDDAFLPGSVAVAGTRNIAKHPCNTESQRPTAVLFCSFAVVRPRAFSNVAKQSV